MLLEQHASGANPPRDTATACWLTKRQPRMALLLARAGGCRSTVRSSFGLQPSARGEASPSPRPPSRTASHMPLRHRRPRRLAATHTVHAESCTAPEPDHISDPAPWWEVTQLAGCRRFNSSLGHPNCSASSAPRTHARHPPSHAPCVHILTTARAPHARAQTSGGGHRPTSPPLPLWLAPLLVGRRRGGRSCRCGPSAAACGVCMCYTHVHGSPR